MQRARLLLSKGEEILEQPCKVAAEKRAGFSNSVKNRAQEDCSNIDFPIEAEAFIIVLSKCNMISGNQ